MAILLSVRMDEQHRYWSDTRRVGGVSEILQTMGFIRPNSFWTDEGRDKGSRLHLVCRQIVTGTVDWNQVEADIYFEAICFKEWVERVRFKPLKDLEGNFLCERMLVSGVNWYAGTFDSFGTIHDSETLVLPDWKRGAAGVSAKYQTALYVHLLCEHSLRLLGKKLYPWQIQRFALERIGKGKPHMEAYTDKKDFDIALSAVTCFNAQVADGLIKLEE